MKCYRGGTKTRLERPVELEPRFETTSWIWLGLFMCNTLPANPSMVSYVPSFFHCPFLLPHFLSLRSHTAPQPISSSFPSLSVRPSLPLFRTPFSHFFPSISLSFPPFLFSFFLPSFIYAMQRQNKTKSKFWKTRRDSSDNIRPPPITCNSSQHFAGKSELFPISRPSFRNVTCSWHLAGNSFIVRCHVTMN